MVSPKATLLATLALMCMIGCSRNETDRATSSDQKRRQAVGYVADVAKGFVGWFAPRSPTAPRSPVWGTATRHGQRLSSGQITLIPTDTSRGTASGLITDDGTYVLYSGTSGLPGVEPGTYTVRLNKDSSKPADDSSDVLDDVPASASLSIAIGPGPQRLDLAFD